MRALVTGGAGQLGSYLCRSLLDTGHEVICVDNLITGDRTNIADLTGRGGFEFWERDVASPFESSWSLDAVFHLASPASPPEYMTIPLETLAVNSQGTWNLLKLAEAHGARFLFASTSEVYGDPEEHPQTEEYWGRVNPNGVRSCYDESKRFGEALTAAYVRAKGVDARIVRIFNTYGPNSRPNDGRMVPNFICQALRGQPMTIYGRGEQTRSLCFVSDTVAGIRSALEADLEPGEVINLGNPDERTVMECAQAISAACGVEFRAVYMDTPVDDPSRRCPDIAKAGRLLGWEPSTPLNQGLEMTVAWFRTRLGISDPKDSALPALS